jgi:hypothetical protein
MSETPSPRCQARPKAARPGYRTDMLCASEANTAVVFGGVEVPVCRMHESMYQRWGDEAEANAELLWGWH